MSDLTESVSGGTPTVGRPAAGAQADTAETAADVRVPLQMRWPVTRRYVVGRLVNAVITVWGVITIVFFALHLTGNPVGLLLPADASHADVARLTRLLGFDQSVVTQYFKFIGQVVSGHFPRSIRYNLPPLGLVFSHLPATLLLGAAGLTGGMVLGLAAGFTAAVGRVKQIRWIPVSFLTALEGIPSFFLGVVLIAIFCISWPILPLQGNATADSIILPAAVIACALAAPVARVFRTSVAEALVADHVRLAQAKGISGREVMFRHVILNSLAPVINVMGVQAGVVLGGAMVTETVFNWPGVGLLTVSAIDNRDYPLVLAAVTVLAIEFVLINLLVDVVAAALDPRAGHR
jgi:peptide/nickel transport system permease protein